VTKSFFEDVHSIAGNQNACHHLRLLQGCQMVSFQTKNPNLGKFLSALDTKVLIYFMVI
jgi:hypothetical protein